MKFFILNNSGDNISISGDPNWDDQILIIDGKRINKQYSISKGNQITVEVKEANECGIIMARDKKIDTDAYQIEVQEINSKISSEEPEYHYGSPNFSLQYSDNKITCVPLLDN